MVATVVVETAAAARVEAERAQVAWVTEVGVEVAQAEAAAMAREKAAAARAAMTVVALAAAPMVVGGVATVMGAAVRAACWAVAS